MLAAAAVVLVAAINIALADDPTKVSASTLQTPHGFRWLRWFALMLGIALLYPFADSFALLASGVWIIVTSIVLFGERAAERHGLAQTAVLSNGNAADAGETQVTREEPSEPCTRPSGRFRGRRAIAGNATRGDRRGAGRAPARRAEGISRQFSSAPRPAETRRELSTRRSQVRFLP